MRDRFEGAQTLSDFIAGAEQNQALWRSIYARASIGEEILEVTWQLPAKRHLLVLLEDWCGDGFNSVPWLARLADQVPDRLELRVLRRDRNPDLMDAHLSPTGARAIPIVMVLNENFEEIGWWGSRPAELQKWFDEVGASLQKDERYRQTRLWYARDRGVSTLREVLATAASHTRGHPSRGDPDVRRVSRGRTTRGPESAFRQSRRRRVAPRPGHGRAASLAGRAARRQPAGLVSNRWRNRV